MLLPHFGHDESSFVVNLYVIYDIFSSIIKQRRTQQIHGVISYLLLLWKQKELVKHCRLMCNDVSKLPDCKYYNYI